MEIHRFSLECLPIQPKKSGRVGLMFNPSRMSTQRKQEGLLIVEFIPRINNFTIMTKMIKLLDQYMYRGVKHIPGTKKAK